MPFQKEEILDRLGMEWNLLKLLNLKLIKTLLICQKVDHQFMKTEINIQNSKEKLIITKKVK